MSSNKRKAGYMSGALDSAQEGRVSKPTPSERTSRAQRDVSESELRSLASVSDDSSIDVLQALDTPFSSPKIKSKPTAMSSQQTGSRRSTTPKQKPSSQRSTPTTFSPKPESRGKKTTPKRGAGSGKLAEIRKESIDSVGNSYSPTTEQLTAAEKRDLGIGTKIEKERHAVADDEEFAHWTQAERDLYNRFADRGAEPLLPLSWQPDFPTMPIELFTDDDDEAYISNHVGKEFQAVKALEALLQTGTQVRDRLIAEGDPSSILQRSVSAYYRWCLADGKLQRKNIKSIFVSTASRKDETTGDVVARTTNEFRALARHYSARSTTPKPGSQKTQRPKVDILPTLYGVIIAKSVLAVVTYDTADPKRQLKTIAIYDFADDEQDVWNAFAVAILLITVRNYLISLDGKDLPKQKEVDLDV